MAAYEQKIAYINYFTLLCEFAFGAFIVRGSACTVNDIFDREFDAAVGKPNVCFEIRETDLVCRAHKEQTISVRQSFRLRSLDLLHHSDHDWNCILRYVQPSCVSSRIIDECIPM